MVFTFKSVADFTPINVAVCLNWRSRNHVEFVPGIGDERSGNCKEQLSRVEAPVPIVIPEGRGRDAALTQRKITDIALGAVNFRAVQDVLSRSEDVRSLHRTHISETPQIIK